MEIDVQEPMGLVIHYQTHNFFKLRLRIFIKVRPCKKF
jgi:hypothetical protein